MTEILVIDDSRAMRMIVMRHLRQAGYGEATFLEASNGREGLEVIRSRGPSLVLSDWNMPEMDGLELLQTLRGSGSDVNFGFVTSETTPQMKDVAIGAGADFVITKPFTVAAFEEALARIAVARRRTR
jgi:two-component system chemotaxis response regulator CheY